MSQDVAQACEQVKKQEAWKYTKLAPIANQEFKLSTAELAKNNAVMAQSAVNQLLTDAYRMVFINGHYAVQYSVLPESSSGIQLMSMHLAKQEFPEQVQPALYSVSNEQREKSAAFVQLNQHLFQDGWFLQVSEKVVIEKPIHIVYVTSAVDPIMNHIRNIGVFGRQSEVTIIEEFVGLGAEKYFNNVVTHLQVQSDTKVQHYKIQNESQQGSHISNIQVVQQRHSSVNLFNLTTGAQLSREEVHVALKEPGAECNLHGLYLLNAKQHSDQHLRVQHQAAHTNSNQLYKGILDQSSTAVFDGKIVVQQHAQKIIAAQNNQNLLLTKTAEINAKPALEIYADDVKCTHGATVGQLDEQALFYLRSRGIEQSQAIELLTYAFGGEVIDQISLPMLQQKVQEIVNKKLRREQVGCDG